MPRQVDHEERRQQIAEALWRIVTRNGMEDVSLRHVATEAGVSMGMVQHYFSSKDEMMMFAFESLSARVEARLLAEQPQGSPIRTMFCQMLPLDEKRRAEAHVAVAFMARASVSPALAEKTSALSVQFKEYIADVLRADKVANPEAQAEILLSVLDGLTVHILLGQITPDAAVQALDLQLERLTAEAGRSRG